MSDWLVDTSALARLHLAVGASEWAARVERGLVRVATVTRLEVGCSARSGKDLRTGATSPPIASMPLEYQTPSIEDRAIEVQMMLADAGHHRAPSVADLIVAATAERAGLVVLHVDEDFDLIAGVTGQTVENLALA